MKNLLLLLLSIFTSVAFAQTTLTQAKKVEATQQLKVNGKSVVGISINSTDVSKSDNLLITEKAAKEYADGIAGAATDTSALSDRIDAKVDKAITITINGVTQNLSANRTYTINNDTASLSDRINSKQPIGNYVTALTGDVSAAGPGSASSTIGANVVSNTKLAQMPTNTLKGNNTGGTANAADLTVTQAKTMMALENVNNTTDLNKPVSTATQAQLDLKAPLASPTFTGTPAAPTASTTTNTTQIATTAFVQQELSGSTLKPGGNSGLLYNNASVGTKDNRSFKIISNDTARVFFDSVSNKVGFGGAPIAYFDFQRGNLTTTSDINSGLRLRNTTVATVGTPVQNSPVFASTANAYTSSGGGSSQPVSIYGRMVGVNTATTDAAGYYLFSYDVNNGGATSSTNLFSFGRISSTSIGMGVNSLPQAGVGLYVNGNIQGTAALTLSGTLSASSIAMGGVSTASDGVLTISGTSPNRQLKLAEGTSFSDLCTPRSLVVGGITAAASCAILDLRSTNKGVLLPVMMQTERDAIPGLTAGLTMYCSDCTATDASTGVEQTYNGSVWKNKW